MVPDNGRIEWLKDKLDSIEGKIDKYVETQAKMCATVDSHGSALKWVGAIIAGVVIATVGHLLGVK